MNKNLRNLTFLLLLCLIPLLTACTLPKSVDDIKNIFSKDSPEAAKDSKDSENPSAFESQTEKSSPLGKLEEILGNKKSMECTYEYDNAEGIIYTDGSNMKIKTEMRVDENIINSNTIYTPEYLYTWMEGQTTGTKIAISDLDKNQIEDNQEEIEVPQTPDYFVNMKYSCEDKAVDSSMFSLPEGIEFTELNLTAISDVTEEIDMCSMCDSIPSDSEKAACKTQFECN